MSSVSMGGCQSAQWTPTQSAQDRMQKLFGKLDANSDGGIDATELKSFVDKVAEKSGTAAADADAIMTSLDSDGNGSVSSTELQDNGKALFDALRQQLAGVSGMNQGPPPPPPPQNDAGSSSTSSSSDVSQLFNALDTNGDGQISSDELSALLSQKSDDKGSAHGADRPPPPDDGFSRLIESVLAEYGSNTATSTTASSTSGGTLSIAA